MVLRRRPFFVESAGYLRKPMDRYNSSFQRKVFRGLLRSDNQVKNHFYSIIRKSIRRMCKLVDIKTHTMNIYSIKPNTISHIFYLGGEGEEKRDGYVNQRNSLSTDASRKRDNCSKIAKTIIFYIFAGK
jgi:hypothetical protein